MVRRFSRLVLLPLLLALAPALCAAPRADKDTSSPAQVDGIVSAAVDDLWAQNDAYWHVGDYPRIIALDRIITQADPYFLDAFNTGAWLMWSSGRDDDAQAFYELAVRDNPTDSAAYYDFGMFLINHRKDYAGAIRVYTQDVTRADPGVLDWRMLAHSYEKAGHWDRAVAVWRKIKARWPHGASDDPSHGAVDDENLARCLSHIAPSQKVPAP